MFSNPVIPGFHPDPSVCRVGADYYLVTSSFEWFPGVPIFHSRDLVHWRQLGHVLDRPSQLDLDGVRPSGGIYAPTIRHHDGVFYMITTLMDEPGNFLVTATDPAGPWSDPIWFPEAGGFDPSLFFDDDGRAWMCGTREKAAKGYDGDTEIWLRELDLASMKLVGEEHVIWEPVQRGGIWAEGPHVYLVDGRYYLLTSEGGTAEDHAVMVARADAITGPYTNNPRNPILTHRHLGLRHPITSTGHPDLVRTQNGDWWSVLLATRPYGGHPDSPLTMAAVRADSGYNLGRETFLTSVRWEDGWPVYDLVEPEMPAPALAPRRWPARPACDHFDGVRLAPEWNHLRTPRTPYWSLADSRLTLRLRPESLTERANPSLVARRQQHIDFAAHTVLEFRPRGDESAGLALIQNDAYQLRLERSTRGLDLIRRAAGEDTLLATAAADAGRVHLAVEAHGQDYQFRYALEPDEWRDLGAPADGRILGSTTAGGFIGTMIALYATSNGAPSANTASFDWFEYRAV
ncbi:glycoside hydrolase 43 family protein [Acrocarpospora phusangensis]|uniref:Glycoside hydrolase 43 family protein n=1 Tax=Acrocarpospora phusangensis TaxID=1070424 RepID=A0A919QFX2_9ACTN|nr:glycoside hydrolase family 43 protein [Acrocarpospora phusangensis]GIH26803.1 glycoside hydrolase 43 family protein [Acrocarpospora phusangensis]